MFGLDFDFESGLFISYFFNINLQLQGYNDGVLVESYDTTLFAYQETFVEVDWGPIDQLVITYPFGFNLTMDDLVIETFT